MPHFLAVVSQIDVEELRDMDAHWADMGMTSAMPTVDEDITEVLLSCKLSALPDHDCRGSLQFVTVKQAYNPTRHAVTFI